MCARAGGTDTTLFFGLGKIQFPQGDLDALIGTADRPLINKRRPRRANLIYPRVSDYARLALVQRLVVFSGGSWASTLSFFYHAVSKFCLENMSYTMV